MKIITTKFKRFNLCKLLNFVFGIASIYMISYTDNVEI